MYYLEFKSTAGKGMSMAKNIQVFGIDLETYTVRENMQFLEDFVTSEEMNIVSVVSPYMLNAALNNEELHNFIKECDLRIIADTVILEVADDKYEQQYSQIRKMELEEQFLKYLIRKKKKIFAFFGDREQLKRFENYVGENYPDLIVAGTCGDGIEEIEIENIINEINSADVDVLLLNFHSPNQEKFIMDYKQLLHTKLCICMGDGVRSRYSSGVRISKLKGLLDQTLFKRKVIKYNSENEQ